MIVWLCPKFYESRCEWHNSGWLLLCRYCRYSATYFHDKLIATIVIMTRSGKIICEWIENWEVSRSNNWTCSTVNRRIKNLKTFLLLVIQKTSTAAVPKFERISLLEYMNGNITETFRSMSAKLFWRCLHWQGQWTWNRVAFMVVLRDFVSNQTRFLDFLQSCLKQHSMSKEISKILYLKMQLLITGDRFIIPSCFRL